jgi:hypothetical protein
VLAKAGAELFDCVREAAAIDPLVSGQQLIAPDRVGIGRLSWSTLAAADVFNVTTLRFFLCCAWQAGMSAMSSAAGDVDSATAASVSAPRA